MGNKRCVWDDASPQILRLCADPLPSCPQERAGALRRAGIFPGLFVALFSGLPLFLQTGSTSGKGCASRWLPEGPTVQAEAPEAVRAQGSTLLQAPELISPRGSPWPREPMPVIITGATISGACTLCQALCKELYKYSHPLPSRPPSERAFAERKLILPA